MAGIIDETGKERYVMHAVDIIHDFYVKKDGKYKVFVENRYKKKNKNRNSDLCGGMINETYSLFYGVLYNKHWEVSGNYYIFVSK